MIQKPWVSPEVVDQVLRYGREEEPLEACGVITPDLRVEQLPNTSPSPMRSYTINSENLVNVIREYVDRCEVDPTQLTRGHFIVWHTHPGGIIGPSPGDLREKLEGFQYVVITLPTGEATIF